MSLSPVSALKLGVGLFIFAGCIAFVLVALYTAYTKLDVMLGYFKNSPAVMIKAPLKNGGPWGRLFVLGAVVGVIKTPDLFISDGGACRVDIANFPQDLKKRLITIYKVGGCFVWALMIYSVIFVVDWSSMGPARFGVAVITIVAMFVWVFLCVLLGRTQIKALGNSFKNSEAIQFRLKLDTGGNFETLIYIVAASVIIACSGIFIKRGTLDASEYKNMPRNLKYKLYVVFSMSVGLVVSLFGLYFLP